VIGSDEKKVTLVSENHSSVRARTTDARRRPRRNARRISPARAR
jgi:hypothetical protein